MPDRYEIDYFGRLRTVPDTSGMLAPYACGSCGHVHDAADVEVIARYSDCSVWRCPKCNTQQDDRTWVRGPGQARRIDR